ncbi:MAG TPA: hypothetical protein VGB70_06645 [Allosphingosinicella sp.]|jgi:hypothetical protein
MAVVMEFQTSPETEIDAKLDALSGKIVRREATPADLVAYQELLAARMRLMRSRFRLRAAPGGRRRLA